VLACNPLRCRFARAIAQLSESPQRDTDFLCYRKPRAAMAPKAAQRRTCSKMELGADAPSAAPASSADAGLPPPIPVAGHSRGGEPDIFQEQQLTEFYMLVTWRDAAGWQMILSYTRTSLLALANPSRE
jgi:hypothetical protein